MENPIDQPKELRHSRRIFAVFTKGIYMNLRGSQISLSAFCGIGFKERVQFGVNLGLNIEPTTLQPEKAEGWGNVVSLRLKYEDTSFFYEVLNFYNKTYSKYSRCFNILSVDPKTKTIIVQAPLAVLNSFTETREESLSNTVEKGNEKTVTYSRIGFSTKIPHDSLGGRIEYSLKKTGSLLPFTPDDHQLSYALQYELCGNETSFIKSGVPVHLQVNAIPKISISSMCFNENPSGPEILPRVFCCGKPIYEMRDFENSTMDLEEKKNNVRSFLARLENVRGKNEVEMKDILQPLKTNLLSLLFLYPTESAGDLIPITNYTDVLYCSFFGSLVFQSVKKFVVLTGEGVFLCLLIGGTFSISYVIADIYIYYFKRIKAKGFTLTHLVLYAFANLIRLVFPAGVCVAYLILLGNIYYGKEKIPFFNLFERLFAAKSEKQLESVAFIRFFEVLKHPFRLYFGTTGLLLTRSRVFLILNNFNVFAILVGSTCFFCYFRLQLNKVYCSVLNEDSSHFTGPEMVKNKKLGVLTREELTALSKQVTCLTFGIYAFSLIKDGIRDLLSRKK